MGGFSGDGGAATSAQLNGPTGISVDTAGNLIVVDSLNNRVRSIGENSFFLLPHDVSVLVLVEVLAPEYPLVLFITDTGNRRVVIYRILLVLS